MRPHIYASAFFPVSAHECINSLCVDGRWDAGKKKKKDYIFKRSFCLFHWCPAVFVSLPPSPSLTEALHFYCPPLRSLGSYYALIYVSCYRWKSCQHPLRHTTEIFSLQTFFFLFTWLLWFFKGLPPQQLQFVCRFNHGGQRNVINPFQSQYTSVCISVSACLYMHLWQPLCFRSYSIWEGPVFRLFRLLTGWAEVSTSGCNQSFTYCPDKVILQISVHVAWLFTQTLHN